jgi:hypothetical protein
VSRHGDEQDEMSIPPGQPQSQGAGDQDEVARFLLELRALGEGEPPPPSPELAALIGGATLLRPRHRRAVRYALRSGIVAAAIVGALVVAAANHDLPQPAQRVVSDFVEVLTPFQISPNQHVAPTPPPTHAPSKQGPVPGEDDSSSPGGEDGRATPTDSEDTSPGGSEDGGASDGSGYGGGSENGAGGGGAERESSSAPHTPGEDNSGQPSSAPKSGTEHESGDH